MTLLTTYQKLVASGEIFAEPQQIAVIHQLHAIYEALIAKSSSLRPWKKVPPKGLYLWGGVGIGKTLLLDMFYYFLPFKDKWRTHFLPFMRDVHAQLHQLQGVRDPLGCLAKQWSKKTRVICFDEFLVNDIADASLLGGLLDALFQQGVCVLFTSNFAPDELYKNGLQRELFLPTIEEIKHHVDVVQLTSSQDYRRKSESQSTYYGYPLSVTAQENLQRHFDHFSHMAVVTLTPLVICDRQIPVVKWAGAVVWFDFLVICGVPRSYEDYLLLTKKFHTILISNVAVIQPHQNDLARNFIQLVDTLYAAKIRLIISAAVSIEKIYTQGQLVFEFARTKSRLVQMQSADWEVDTSFA